MSLDFLLEIGAEEIPHWMIPGALDQLRQLDLFGATPHVDATPRRLAVWAVDLPERTPDTEQVIKGPPISSGQKAAEGFARKQGADVSALRQAGKYYELVKRVQGRLVRDLLAESLPAAILGLQWPKTMYWTGGRNGPRFIRPIRWLVALLGEEVIPFTIAGVASGRHSRGHRILGASSFPVTTANYGAELRTNGVLLSSAERRRKIQTEAAALGAKLDPELLETLTFITEYPTAIRGDFDPEYLKLPGEVLTEVMRHHQKYFAVEASPGQLAPHFVAVLNTSGDPAGLVKHGHERVLKARFNDARFFWNVDQQRTLAERVEDLAKVTFQAKLGSYKEKAERIVALVEELGGGEHAQRAALLAKCDLTTEMVKEFTGLQGVIGGLYARAQGEPEEVATAIYEHYKPLSINDAIPATPAGQILALADKLDTLRGCFAVGLIPTGSKDPFALRRAAQGVVKILAEARLDYRLDALTSGALYDFMLERVEHYFREVRGFRYDEVNAVMRVGVGSLPDLEQRLTAVARVRPTPDFEPLAAAFKRINNILKQASFAGGQVEPAWLEAGPERELFDAYRALPERGPLEDVARLRPLVDRYFDKIMVNAPDEKVRFNRLSMLSDMLRKFSTIADFSEIVTSGEQN